MGLHIFLSVEAVVVSCIQIIFLSHEAVVLYFNINYIVFLSHWAVVDSFVSLEAVLCCLYFGGTWMCGESWLAVKDSLTHHPSSQGWASLCPQVCCWWCTGTCMCMFIVYMGCLSSLPTRM